jgi:hypothetical protein
VDELKPRFPKPSDATLFGGLWEDATGGFDIATDFGADVGTGLKKPPPFTGGEVSCGEATVDR